MEDAADVGQRGRMNQFFWELADTFRFSGRVIRELFHKPHEWSEFGRQCYLTGIKSLGLISITAFIMGLVLTIQTRPVFAELGADSQLPGIVMVAIMVVYLILGCFIDSAAMVTLTIPIFFPLAKSLGFHPVWFGIIVTRAMEIAMITPPVGMNVYVISGVAKDVPMTDIFRGIMPFLFADVVHVALLFIFPAIVLFLPSIMR